MKIAKAAGIGAISAIAAIGIAPFGASAGNLVEQGVIAFGSDLTYAPFAYMDEGKPAGFDVEIAEAIAGRLGLDAKWVDTRFAALIPGIRAGHFDAVISALYVTEERQKVLSFVPYTKAGSSILVMTAADDKPATVTDLCGKAVSSIRGASWTPKLAAVAAEQCKGATIEVREFDTDAQALQAMRSGAVAAQVADNLIAAEAVRRNPAEFVVSSSEVFFPVLVGIAVLPDNKGLLADIARAFGEIRADGTYESLRAKYDMAPVSDAEIAEISGL